MYKKVGNLDQNRLTFYSIYNHTAIDCVKDKKHIFISDSSLVYQTQKINYHCANHWNIRGLSPIEDTQKVILNKKTKYPLFKLLISETHLIFDNTLICVNHSSHELNSVQHFKKRILFVNNYFFKSWNHIEQYDHILLNNNLFNYKDTVLLNGILENTKVSFHNLNSGGSISYEL